MADAFSQPRKEWPLIETHVGALLATVSFPAVDTSSSFSTYLLADHFSKMYFASALTSTYQMSMLFLTGDTAGAPLPIEEEEEM